MDALGAPRVVSLKSSYECFTYIQLECDDPLPVFAFCVTRAARAPFEGVTTFGSYQACA